MRSLREFSYLFVVEGSIEIVLLLYLELLLREFGIGRKSKDFFIVISGDSETKGASVAYILRANEMKDGEDEKDGRR